MAAPPFARKAAHFFAPALAFPRKKWYYIKSVSYTHLVKNCVLFRNVRIEKGASVENCSLFKDTVGKRGAILRGVITDKYVTVSENVTLMGHERYPIVIAKGATV